jgi:hypothetical protein
VSSPEQLCRLCGTVMRRGFNYAYCTSVSCGHKEWDNPKIPCLCNACNRERRDNPQKCAQGHGMEFRVKTDGTAEWHCRECDL